MKESDRRITPEWLWKVLLEFAGGRFTCDVCTEPDNPLGADLFYTEANNALSDSIKWPQGQATCWGNFPYSNGSVLRWGNKAVEEAERGAEIVALTQADVSTRWWRFLRDNTDAVCLLGKRVGFLKPDGGGGYVPMTGAKFGSAVWYWGRRRRRFARVFGAHGEVLPGLGPQERDDG